MLTNYILSCKKASCKLPEKPVVVKTIVTTKLINKLCEKYGCELKNVLTGFKYIGEVILNLEKKHEENRYLFGFEESYGYLSGTYVRDKDAVVASMLVCEMAAYYKKQGKSLAEVIDGLYEEFGYYLNQTYSFEFDGAAGMQKMSDIMTAVRDNTPKSIAGYDVVKVSDYFLRKETDVATGSVTDIDLPKSNVIALHLADDNAVIIRPSGTEPKIKLYITSVGKDKDNAAKSVKSSLLQAKRFSALSNWNRHIIVAPKVKGTDFSVPCFYVYFIKNATPLFVLLIHCITRKAEVTAVAVTSVIG